MGVENSSDCCSVAAGGGAAGAGTSDGVFGNELAFPISWNLSWLFSIIILLFWYLPPEKYQPTRLL